MPKADTTSIPPGYTFINLDTFISVQGKAVVDDLLKKAIGRNPDVFDMYIYDDFFGYALLDLIDQTLSFARGKIAKKQWAAAFYALEGLTVFLEVDNSWLLCDDGKRTNLTNQAYGALVVTLLRDLKAEDRLDTANFPSLETFLRNVVEWHDVMEDMDETNYGRVCKAIGLRCFSNKSDAVVALEKARIDEWVATLEAGLQERAKDKLKELAQKVRDGGTKSPWFTSGELPDEDRIYPDLILNRVWKKYRDHLRQCLSGPVKGPSWDICDWSLEDKAKFEFGAGSQSGVSGDEE